MKSLLTRASALALLIGGMAAGAAFAQEASTTTTTTTGDGMAAAAGVNGSFVGSPGGTFATWMVDLPSGKDVTLKLAHWPCNAGGAVGFNVWGASGKLASSSLESSCTQQAMFATGDGGKAEIQAYNYLDGLPVWYRLTADGMTLPGATAPAAPAATTTTTAATTTTAMTTTATTSTAATTTAAPATAATTTAATTTAAAPAGDTLNVQSQTLLGNGGGAANRHDLMVKEGQSYTVKMNYGTDMGGTWPGIGFKVWGPDGWVASSHSTGMGMAEAMFTGSGNVKYTVEVYNYHPGVTAFYGLNSTMSDASSN